MIYLIGALKNPQVPVVAKELRAAGHEVFDDWYSPGPRTDEHWQDYERDRGRTFAQALAGAHAQNVYIFDRYHLSRCSVAVLLLPAGKSAHLELGWCLGQGKRGYILVPETVDRFDVMYAFADAVVTSVGDLLTLIQGV